MINEFDLNSAMLAGSNLIEAGAGTGKTYNITGLYIRLLLEKRLKVSEILTVTFTIAATEELKDRIRRKIIDTKNALKSGRSDEPVIEKLIQKIENHDEATTILDLALKGFDEAAIFTIHGFCHRILRDHAFESGGLFDSEFIKDQRHLEAEIGADFWREKFYNASPLLLNYLFTRSGEKITSPESLLNAVAKHLSKPNLKIIPNIVSPDLSQAETEYKKALGIFQTAYPAMKKEIEQILFNDNSLNKNIYRQASIPAWFMQMDTIASDADNNPNLFDKFVNITTGKINNSLKKNSPEIHHPFFDICQELYDKHTALTKTYDEYILSVKINLYEYIKTESKKRKQELNIIHYDDLLSGLYAALTGPEGMYLAKAIRDKYKAALIDEFQDTDPLQYGIFKAIYADGDSTMFLIGDPKQAIYSFRGADIFAYIEAVSRLKSIYTLTTNWRSDKNLVEAVNSIFITAVKPFIYEQIPFYPASAKKQSVDDQLRIAGEVKPPFTIWFWGAGDVDPAFTRQGAINKGSAQEIIADQVGYEIVNLLHLIDKNEITIGTDHLKTGDIAILVRTNKEAEIIKQALNRRNIKSILYSDRSVFETSEAEQLERVLAAIAEPSSERLIRAALTTSIFGLDASQVFEIVSNDTIWEKYLEQFRNYNSIWKQRNFINTFLTILINQQVRQRYLAMPDGERRLTDILHLGELLHRQTTSDKTNPADLVKWLSRQRIDSDIAGEEKQLRLESDENAVKIVTIHKSKGLEYPIVFCPFNWGDSRLTQNRENIFHDSNNNGRLTLDLGSDNYEMNKLQCETENLAENLRLLYVSLTRAKYRCYLAWGQFNKAGSSALAYLLHQPSITNQTNMLNELEEYYKNLPDDQALIALKALEERAAGSLELKVKPDCTYTKYQPRIVSEIKLSDRIFTGTINRNWRISSFSHLSYSRHINSELPDYDLSASLDNIYIKSSDSIVEKIEPSGIHAFPKGARAGTFIHDIFENLDFANNDTDYRSQLITRKLTEYGYSGEWCDSILAMTNNTLQTELKTSADKIKLEQITFTERLSELEFYFPLNKISNRTLAELFHKHNIAGIGKSFPQTLEKLEFAPVEGFMKGYIDLLFRFNGKYYLVDWKSNHLGNSINNYNRENINEVMLANYYILQYHIYVLALHQYLSLRLNNYNYKRDFGGVFYLFVRGLDPNNNDQNGIFFDKPEMSLVDDLKALMIPEPIR